MKNISKFIIAGMIAMTVFIGTHTYAQTVQTTQLELRATIEQQIKVLIVQLIEQLKSQLAEMQQESDTDDSKFDVTQTDRYPKQTTDNVMTTASAISVDGNANNYVEYEIEFDLTAFGSESYIDENFANSIDFSIQNGGTTVYDSDAAQNGLVIASISSGADIDNGYYRIDENTSETFTITLTYNPYGGTPAGSGSYRMQLDAINYSTTMGGAVNTYNTSSLNKFRTKSVNIIN
jgi:hypothetical protein